MRRVIIALLCCLLLTTAVSAESYVSDLQSAATVSSDGTCEVTVTVQLSLEEDPGAIWFPLPKAARDITVNGGSVKTKTTSATRDADLSGEIYAAGQHTLVIRYSLPDAVSRSGGQLYLTLQILSGFSYPVEKMRFTVTLPGEPERDPEFVSTYYQEEAGSLLDYSFSGNTITCSFKEPLKDHESLTMTLAVSEEMFPQSVYKRWSLSSDDVAMYICTFLALIYWLVFLRAKPTRPAACPNGPEGICAGEYPCVLTGSGVDFTAMVISWAQMGYLLIQVDDSGRVLLHKRMNMGNERSDVENYYFRALFSRRRVVDGTGYRYADLCRKAATAKPGVRSYYHRNSGNPYYFRILAAAVGLFGGVSLASAMAADTAGRTALSFLLGALGAAASWMIHAGAAKVHLRKKRDLYIAVAASLLWLILSTRAGEPGVALYILVTQWLAGFAAAYGGRRTDMGRQLMKEAMGLRRFLRTVNRKRLQQILKSNPEYYYDMAPYALSMGVDRIFAWRFGSTRLPECPYLTSGMDGHMTAWEWNQLLRSVTQALDAMQTRQFLDRFRRR